MNSGQACPTPGAHLCLISGMLMQLAAATAAKGTYRPMRAGKCWGEKQENVMKRVWGQSWLSLDLPPSSCKTLRCPSPTGKKNDPSYPATLSW